MFALHGFWRADRRLALWAEDAAATGAGRGGRPGEHPYALPAEAVAGLLRDAGAATAWLADRAAPGRSVLSMPTRAAVPLPSPELGAPPPAAGGTTLRPWTVPSLLFAPDEAAQLLGELYDPRRPLLSADQADVPYGASLRWLTAVHDLAWRLVGRGRLLPAVGQEDGQPYARWRPVPDEAGWQEIRSLAAAIPPVCRAEEPVGRGGAEIVAGLLDTLVDREARAALETRPSLLPTGRRPATTAEEVWLRALDSTTGRIDAVAAAGLHGLGERLAEWHRSEPAVPRPLRLCFRLAEPLGPDQADLEGGVSDDDWRLDFLIQAVEEPSLTVAASDLWAGGAALSALEGVFALPREALLTDLERAGRCWPDLGRAMRSAGPAGLSLDRAGALEFLRHGAPVLAQAGFGVLLPSWWRKPARLGLTLTTRAVAPGTVGTRAVVDQDAVVAFRWQVAIGDLALTEEELKALAVARQPLVRVRGQWVEADPARIAAAVAFLEREGSGTMTSAAVLRTAAEPDSPIPGLPVAGVNADGRLGDLLRGRTAPQEQPFVPPAGFGATLRPYQERGVAWMSSLSRLGLGAVLADDMGLGKTAQTLALLASEHGDGRRPTLVVCPMSLVGNWQREAARFAPMLRVHVHHGAERLDGGELRNAAGTADLVITTYGLVQRDAAALRTIGWRRIVADEAQHIKNSATRQARAVRSIPAEHRVALTGTPVENRLSDLHSILDFANPGLFGSATAFKELYSARIEQGGDEAAAAALRRRTRPFVLRRLKSDPEIARELPEKQEMTVMCNLTAEQAGLYQAVVSEMLARAGRSRGIERKGVVLSALGRLKQICNHPAQFLKEPGLADGSRTAGRSGKVARLEETLEEALAEGDKTLCFTQFAEFGALLRHRLTDRFGDETLFLHGGVSRSGREEMIERFQDPAGPSVFVLSLKAGGTGLNLTAARQVVHVDRWWNPAVEDQATDRAFRLGQRGNVQVRKFVCVGTVEERIDAMIESKRALARSVVGTGEEWLTGMSTDELRDLVALSADAVSE